jgi:hypothetical protein
MRKLLCSMALALGLVSPALADKPAAKEEGVKPDQVAKLTEHLEAEFPAKVVRPAILRTLQHLFRNEVALNEQVKDSVQASLSSVARRAREHLLEMIDALNNKDRAAFDTATRKYVAVLGDRKAYLGKAVAKLLPDIAGRARPLVRVGVARNYTCDSRFLGRALGLGDDPKAAAQTARKLNRAVRKELCTHVRQWAEKRAVVDVDKLVEDIGHEVRGEKSDLGKEGEEAVYSVRKALDRELVVYVGGYRESMDRIREGLQRLAEGLPPPPPKEEKPPAPVSKPPALEAKPPPEAKP